MKDYVISRRIGLTIFIWRSTISGSPLSPAVRIVTLIPVYNEAKHLPGFLPQLPLPVEVCFVNDGSSDETLALLQQYSQLRPQVTVLHMPINRGKSYALIQGMEYLASQGRLADDDCVVLLDGDGQHDARLLLNFVDKFARSGVDMLVARRRFDDYCWTKAWGNRLLTSQARWLSGVPWHDTQCGMRVFRAGRISQVLSVMRSGGYCSEQEMCVALPLLGWKVANNFFIRVLHDRSNSTFASAWAIFAAGWRAWWRYAPLRRWLHRTLGFVPDTNLDRNAAKL